MADTVYVVDNGLAIVTNRLKGTGTEPAYVGWGTGATTAAVNNTGLQTPAAEARTAGTTSQQTTTTTGDTYRNVATITCTGAGKAITEVAMFDASTIGNCFLRGTFDAINVSVGDSIQFTINTVFNQA